jgi:hypothetical protein
MDTHPGSTTYSDPKSLVRMLEIDDSTQREWHDAEVGAMLKHQLAAPIASELKLTPARRDELAKAKIVTFADLIDGSKVLPPLWVLEETKQFAKLNLGRIEGPLRQVATVLYYTAIAVALARHQKRITDLNSDQLKSGLAWVQGQAWIAAAPGLAELMTQAAATV